MGDLVNLMGWLERDVARRRVGPVIPLDDPQVPLTKDSVRRAASEALGGRPFPPELVSAVVAEANVVGDLFRPERGYLTTDAEVDRAVRQAVSSALHGVRLTLSLAFADELTRVLPPEFVAPPAGSWVAERWSRDGSYNGAWHRASGDVVPPPAWRRDREWPRVRSTCGHYLHASWRDDGSPVAELVVRDEEPRGACGRCLRLAARAKT